MALTVESLRVVVHKGSRRGRLIKWNLYKVECVCVCVCRAAIGGCNHVESLKCRMEMVV